MKPENAKESKPPYLSYKTLSNFITSLRASGVPNRIDRSVLPGLSGAAQSNLISTLKFFGFIESDGAPSISLVDFVENPKTEKAVLTKLVKEKYDFVFNGTANIQAATESQLLEKFREKDLSGQTVRKCLSFFVAICNECGIPLSPHLKTRRGPSAGTPSGTRRYKKRRAGNGAAEEPLTPKGDSGNSLQAQLLAKFPAFDPNWDAETQKKWFDSFEKFMKLTETKSA